jgi:prepilin-type N-terminal cleavage/methylation domain-containing protein
MKMHHRLSFEKSRARRGFSLVEVLLAVFILGIGLIMVASVFPVGANWTRQTTEQSVAQTIALNAVSVIQNHYGPNGDLHINTATNPLGGPHLLDADAYIFSGSKYDNNPLNYNSILKSATNPFLLQVLPGFLNIPATERSFQFGTSTPFPARNPQACTYFWTAMAKLDNSYAFSTPATNEKTRNDVRGAAGIRNIILSPSYKYDIYIFVFHKGSADQVFSINSPKNPGTEIFNTRYHNGGGAYETWIPSLNMVNPSVTSTANSGPLPVGWIGVGMSTGTVFHQIVGGQTRPQYGKDVNSSGPENIVYSPPADGTGASPLIYVYQTSLTF